MRIEWEDDARIRVDFSGGAAVVSANRAGLLSLSKQFAALAEEAKGSHIHYDEGNSLGEGSAELIVERAE